MLTSHTRILFVDDEPEILNGLRRMLRSMRDRWDMVFVEGGEAAIAEMDINPVDLLITDMRMPRMDGATLLEKTVARWPGTLRIVLSGQFDGTARMRAIGVTHAFLSKPCDTETLVAAIQRALAIRERIRPRELRDVIVGLLVLPSRPQAHLELQRELASEDPSVAKLSAIFESDPALTAKLLQVANFSLFGSRSPLTTVAKAIMFLGSEVLAAIVLHASVIRQLSQGARDKLPLAAYCERTMRVMAIAREIGTHELLDGDTLDALMTAAALHDIGALLLAVNYPARYGDVLRKTAAGHDRSVEESRIFGSLSTRVGAYLLDLWGLPHATTETIAYLADPGTVEGGASHAMIILHAVTVLASGPSDNIWPGPLKIVDEEAVRAAGLIEKLPVWRRLSST